MFNSRLKYFTSHFPSPKDAKTIPESEWDKHIRDSNSSVFELMFRTYYSRLCQFAYRSLGSTHTAEDLVQSVFFNIWKNRKQWYPQCTPSMYLFKATRNQVINHLKHKKVEKISDLVDINTISTDSNKTPESIFREMECSKTIQGLIERLPARCKLIFLMKKEDGFTYNEIAEILDISVKTVETQMGRALRYLRENLTEYS